MMAGTLGWIMEAPAATAYAVLPVGVDTITPDKGGRVLKSLLLCYEIMVPLDFKTEVILITGLN